MNRLTDRRVFEERLLCTGCGMDLATYDENTPPGPCKHPDFQPENNRRFLPLAETVKDISCIRAPGHEEPGTEAGGALVAIEQRFVVHSPDGFEWGYHGSGPADLALNVLALFVPPPEAWRLHQEFKRAFIAPLPRRGGILRAAEIMKWIREEWDDAA
jgi:hypothetical protein